MNLPTNLPDGRSAPDLSASGSLVPVPATPASAPPPPARPLVTIGDITVTNTTVITPVGSIPLAKAQFNFSDMSRTERVTPAWAIVLAIIGFLFFLLGLLFLLVKEERTTGAIQVIVTGPGFMHTFQSPVSNSALVRDFAGRVNYAKSLVAAVQAR